MFTEWSNFFVAAAGAAAALTGLLFVGVSISLPKILTVPTLPTRALLSLTLLVTILAHSLLLLVPGQSIRQLGTEVLLLAGIAWISILRMDVFTIRRIDPLYRRQQVWNMGFDQIALLPYLIAGILLLNGTVTGMYWLVPAFIFSFIKAVLDAWVLLVEIHR